MVGQDQVMVELTLEIILVIKQKRPDCAFAAISDEIALWDEYVEVFRGREEMGGRRETADQLISTAMDLARRCLMSPTMSVIFDGPLSPVESRLESWHIIIGEEEFIYRFKHEKFQDYLYSRLMCGQGKMPDAVLTEIDRHRVRGILPLMQAIYKARSSPKLEPFLRNTLLPDEIPFFAQTAVLNQYIRAVFSAEDVKAVLVIIEALQKNSRLREWFFRNRPSDLWAPLLFAAGFLNEAPPPIEVQGGYRLGSWDAQEYLISVAGYVPQVVLAHFEKLNGHPYYFKRAIYALRLIPVREADKAVPSLLKKLADPEFVRIVGEEAFELTTAMAKADLTETAFALFRALTVPQAAPKPRSWEYEGGLRMFFNSESVALLPTKEYHQVKFWRPAVNELARLDIERLVAELERLLLLTLRIEAETKNRGEEFDRTSYWRIAVEETGQDHGEKYKDLLTELLRDNLDRLADRNPAAAEAIVDRYLDHEVEILRRLGLYLLWRFPAQFRAQVNKELFDPVNVDDPGIHHEYFMLLQHGYPHLDPEEKGRLEQMILAGPDAIQLKEMAERANRERGEDPEAYAKRYRKRWIQERLWMIREYLAGDASSELQLLTDELSEPDHPAFTHWSSGVRGMSSVSPIPAEELREMPPESLIVYLRDWKQGVRDYSRGIEESIEALSGQVAETILSDPDRYGDYIDEIARLRPAYATALINHYFDGRVDPDTLRRFRLSLIKSLLADETIRKDLSGDYGSGWVAFRYAAVDYVQGLMEQKGRQVPTEELPFLRDILITLVEDPDPESNADRAQEDWTEHNDPLTVAISHVRPKALNVLIDYACYVARRGEGEDQKGFGPKRLEPMIEQTLTRKLDWRTDPSLSVHSIFGRCLNQLCWLDLEWVKTRLDDIFPEGEESASAAFFTIAWFSFVTSRQGVYAPVFDLLREKYGRAIERLKNRYEAKSRFNPMEGFAFHLIVEYLYADYELHPADGRQNLIVRFFNEMPAEVRGYAVKKIAPEYQHSKKDEPLAVKHWQRIRALWQWRLNQATLMGFPSDFKGEMEWFSELLDALPEQENIASMWPILQGLVPYVEQHDWVWSNLENYLSREVNGDPVRAIQFFGAMHDRLERFPHDYSGEARAILEVGAARAESRSETLTLLERIAKGGYDGFDHLYDKYAGRR